MTGIGFYMTGVRAVREAPSLPWMVLRPGTLANMLLPSSTGSTFPPSFRILYPLGSLLLFPVSKHLVPFRYPATIVSTGTTHVNFYSDCVYKY